MKLGNLLEEVKIGIDEYKSQENAKAILETFDDETDKYKISKLMNILNVKLTEDKNENNVAIIDRLKKASIKIEMLEDKKERAYGISTSYARMKLDSLVEDFNIIMKELESKKKMRSLDNDILGHSLALMIFEMEDLMNQAEVCESYSMDNVPETLKPFIKKELKIINETIG